MKKLSDYPLIWKLLLVPVVAILGFAAYLIYPFLQTTRHFIQPDTAGQQ